MQKIKFNFDFPVVLKRIGPYVTLSVPDMGLSQKILLDTNTHACDEDVFLNVLQTLIQETKKHIETKKWIPKTSTIKEILKSQDADLSLPEFCQRLNQHIKISENTVRREISRGKIITSLTSGGHRRIPETEINRYLNEIQKKPAADQDL